MDILCDQHVPNKYVRALSAAEDMTVKTVRDVLAADATDAEIALFAATHDWVVLTNDDDFYKQDAEYGLLVYSQLDPPTPGKLRSAVQAIDRSYANSADIVEVVPGGWI